MCSESFPFSGLDLGFEDSFGYLRLDFNGCTGVLVMFQRSQISLEIRFEILIWWIYGEWGLIFQRLITSWWSLQSPSGIKEILLRDFSDAEDLRRLYWEDMIISGSDTGVYLFDYKGFGIRNQSIGLSWMDLMDILVGLRRLTKRICVSRRFAALTERLIGKYSVVKPLKEWVLHGMFFTGSDTDSGPLIVVIGLVVGLYGGFVLGILAARAYQWEIFVGSLLLIGLWNLIFLKDMEVLIGFAELSCVDGKFLISVSRRFVGYWRFSIYGCREKAVIITISLSYIGYRGLKFKFFLLLIFLSLRGSVLVGVGVVMSQLNLNKAKGAMVRTETVKISGSLLAHRIQQFSLTLIGRLMNPCVQRMESLVANMPKIWKLEDKVVGNDLGLGKFQFNFDNEEDLLGVLQNVPYHFDGWMVALVRWEPIIDISYPSAISFWVKITEIPLHFWEESTIRAIGKAIGEVKEIDSDSGSVYVTVNGFNPLLFQVVVPFDTGDEIVVSLEYEKLCGICRHCSRLTHDVGVCPELRRDVGMPREDQHKGRFITGSSSNAQAHDGQWEKPRKPAAKRALEFPEADPRDGFSYKKDSGDYSRHYSRRQDKHQGSSWAKKNGSKGSSGENSSKSGQKVVQKLTIPLEVSQGLDKVIGEPLLTIQEEAEGVDLPVQIAAVTDPKEDTGVEDGEMAGITNGVLGNMGDVVSMDTMGNESSNEPEGMDTLKVKAGTSAGAAKGTKNSGKGALPKPPADT